jgi:hypothetical protein
MGPISCTYRPEWFKIVLATLTVVALGALWGFGRSAIGHGKSKLTVRTFDIEA